MAKNREEFVPNNRKPVYDQDLVHRRIISAPNGLWLPQSKAPDDEGTREYDPWQNIHAPVSYGAAMMSAFGPRIASQKVPQ